MKKLLLILAMVFLVQNPTYADEGKGKGKRFEENKGRFLEDLNKKLGFLNTFKGCVTSAGSREELKSCKMKNKKNMTEFRTAKKANKEERKEVRAARKAEREKRRAAREQGREN
jgi:hypothetical protein